MGIIKKYKKFTGTIGKAVGDATGSELIGRSVSSAIGGGLLTGNAGMSGYSMVERQQTQAKNAMEQAKNLQDIEAKKNSEIADQTRLRLLAEEDVRKQLEEEKKRTTFAGSSIQGIAERKKLLGV